MTANGRRDSAEAAREAALQMLYARELAGQDWQEIERWYTSSHPLTEPVRLRAARLLQAANTHQERIEQLIRRHAVGWRLERISVIDRSLLKLATAELLGNPTEGSAVAIRGALRLGKRFSQPEALKFVHGLLEAIARDLAASAAAEEPT